MPVLGVSQSPSSAWAGVGVSVTVSDHRWGESWTTVQQADQGEEAGRGAKEATHTQRQADPPSGLWGSSLVSEDGRVWSSNGSGIWEARGEQPPPPAYQPLSLARTRPQGWLNL